MGYESYDAGADQGASSATADAAFGSYDDGTAQVCVDDGTQGGATSTSTASGGRSVDVRYNVPGMSQPTPTSCWATAFAMLINYVQGTQITPYDVGDTIGHPLSSGDNNTDDARIARAYGLTADGCTCMNIDGWAQMLQNHGPLYIGIRGNTHAVLVTGMTSDGTPEGTTFYINDPWDGAVSKSYNQLTQVYEDIDNETEFYVVHG